MRYHYTWIILLLSISYGHHVAAEPVSQDDEATAAMMQQHTRNIMQLRPSRATKIGLVDEDLGSRINDRMDDYNRASMRVWRRTVKGMRRDLQGPVAAQLPPLTRAALDDIYDVYQGDAENPFGFIDSAGRHRPYVINQISHPLADVPQMMDTFQRVATPEDAADYLRRLWAISSLVDGVLAKFNGDADAGWIPPQPLLVGAMDFFDEFVAPAPQDHSLVTALMIQVDGSEAFTSDQRARIRNEAVAVVAQVVYPSYRNALKTVNDRLPEARKESGIWAQPLGEQFYRHAIAHEARSDKTADQIHALGLAEVERILAQMDTGLSAQGYSEGTVGERMRSLSAEDRFQYPDTSAGRKQLLEDIESRILAMDEQLPGYFGRLPGQGVEVRRTPVLREAGAASGQYDGPAIDGSRPGIFWINLRSMQEQSRIALPTLTYHETVPGHHLQVALAREQSGRPLLWSFDSNSAFSEGWALYSEQLAAEVGVYANDPFGDLGRLQDELFRAVRLVVDTGIHHKRWSRETAIDYMLEVTGMGEVSVTAEIERYMALPGQALSYKLGMLEILEMREAAAAELGQRFDLKSFHDKVLQTGPVSMPLLREQIEAWVKTY
jgi:uncharacterized protein (DUF885 family)